MTVRNRALQAVGVLRVREAGPRLREIFEQNRRRELGTRALAALARIGDPAQADLFQELLTASDPERRRLAIEGLGRIADPSLLPSFKKDFQRERDADVRMSYNFAMVLLGDRAFLDSIVLGLGGIGPERGAVARLSARAGANRRAGPAPLPRGPGRARAGGAVRRAGAARRHERDPEARSAAAETRTRRSPIAPTVRSRSSGVPEGQRPRRETRPNHRRRARSSWCWPPVDAVRRAVPGRAALPPALALVEQGRFDEAIARAGSGSDPDSLYVLGRAWAGKARTAATADAGAGHGRARRCALQARGADGSRLLRESRGCPPGPRRRAAGDRRAARSPRPGTSGGRSGAGPIAGVRRPRRGPMPVPSASCASYADAMQADPAATDVRRGPDPIRRRRRPSGGGRRRLPGAAPAEARGSGSAGALR